MHTWHTSMVACGEHSEGGVRWTLNPFSTVACGGHSEGGVRWTLLVGGILKGACAGP